MSEKDALLLIWKVFVSTIVFELGKFLGLKDYTKRGLHCYRVSGGKTYLHPRAVHYYYRKYISNRHFKGNWKSIVHFANSKTISFICIQTPFLLLCILLVFSGKYCWTFSRWFWAKFSQIWSKKKISIYRQEIVETSSVTVYRNSIKNMFAYIFTWETHLVVFADWLLLTCGRSCCDRGCDQKKNPVRVGT